MNRTINDKSRADRSLVGIASGSDGIVVDGVPDVEGAIGVGVTVGSDGIGVIVGSDGVGVTVGSE